MRAKTQPGRVAIGDDRRRRSFAGRVRTAFDWTFRNRHTGQVTIAQFPNLSLSIFLVGSVVRRLLHPTDTSRTVLDVVLAVSVAWWAGDEVVRGVNPWRRGLGAIVLAVVIVGRFALRWRLG